MKSENVDFPAERFLELQACQFFSAHARKVFAFPLVYEGTCLYCKPIFFRAPETVFERFVAPLLGQQLASAFAITDVPVIYAKLPDSHTAPPQSIEKPVRTRYGIISTE